MKGLVLALVVLGSGCSLLPRQPRPGFRAIDPAVVQACKNYDNLQIGWGAASVVVTSLAGAGGLTTAFVDQIPRYVTGALSIFLAGSGALSVYFTKFYIARLNDCVANAGGK